MEASDRPDRPEFSEDSVPSFEPYAADLTAALPALDERLAEVRADSRRYRRRRTIASGVGAALLVMALLAVGFALRGSPAAGGKSLTATLAAHDSAGPGQASTTRTPNTTTNGGAPTGTTPTAKTPTGTTGNGPGLGTANPEAPTDSDEDALDGGETYHGIADDGGGQPPVPKPTGTDEPVNLEPVDNHDPANACPTLVGGGVLLVGPDPLVLESGKLTGTVLVRNCGHDKVDWQASTVPSVSLAAAGGSTKAGEVAKLDFTIKADQWEPGAVEFKVKVTETGASHYVEVHGFRPTLGKELVAAKDLVAAPGSGGCANQCITKAVPRSFASTPNIAIDIATNTDAQIFVWASTVLPTVTNGVPSIAGWPAAVSPNKVKSFTAELKNLAASTKYYVVIKAVDGNGKISFRTGSFTTINPVKPGNFANPVTGGCSLQCITTAVITDGADYTAKHLRVATNAPAGMQVFVSRKGIVDKNGKPGFADAAELWDTSGLEFKNAWETELTNLLPDTIYHVIVMATDIEGRQSFRTGWFRSDEAPLHDVTFELLSIRVTDDGDSGINRGELSFSWAVGNESAGHKAEQKVTTGDEVHFPEVASVFVVRDVGGFLPLVQITAFERDPDGLFGEFCSMGTGVYGEPGHNGGCDLTWNSAGSGIVSADAIASLPTCESLGAGPGALGRHCLKLETVEFRSGYPMFTALVAVSE